VADDRCLANPGRLRRLHPGQAGHRRRAGASRIRRFTLNEEHASNWSRCVKHSCGDRSSRPAVCKSKTLQHSSIVFRIGGRDDTGFVARRLFGGLFLAPPHPFPQFGQKRVGSNSRGDSIRLDRYPVRIAAFGNGVSVKIDGFLSRFFRYSRDFPTGETASPWPPVAGRPREPARRAHRNGSLLPG
jgi:hypothetical protein